MEDIVEKEIQISGLWCHNGNIFDMSKHVVAIVDLKSSYNFHNGHSVDIKKGDKVFIIFNGRPEHKHYHWEYRTIVYRDGEWVGHHGDKVSRMTYETYDFEYSLDRVFNMLDNFRLQLEGKITPLDVIMKARVFPKVKAGDVLVSFAWDNGLKFCPVIEVSKNTLLTKEYSLTKHGFWETSWQEEEREVTFDWLCKYYVPTTFKIEDLVAGRIVYEHIIDSLLEDSKKLRAEMFKKAYKKIKI